MVHCKVSVCIPTYNYAAFLGEAIESILRQSFEDFELLIIDDNSSDDTRFVVEAYAQKDSRIRFIGNPANVGMVQNWNMCIAQARGEYIKFVFGDDKLARTDALEQMVSLLEADSSVSLVCSARNFIDENSRMLQLESHFNAGTMQGSDVITDCLSRNKNLIGEPSAVMFRRAQAMRGFKTNYRQIVDLEMWFHLLEKGAFAYVDQPLCCFRFHDRQQTAKNKKDRSDLDDIFSLRDDYLFKHYVKISGFMKKYIAYDHCYGVWKLYKNGELSRDDASEVIDRHYGFGRFKLGLPLYKMINPLMKVYRKGSLVSRANPTGR